MKQQVCGDFHSDLSLWLSLQVCELIHGALGIYFLVLLLVISGRKPTDGSLKISLLFRPDCCLFFPATLAA